MKKYLLAVCLFFATTLSVFAQDAPDPQALYLNLKVQEVVNDGDFIVVDARDTNANNIQWRVSAGTTFRVYENGRVAICGTGGSKSHTFMVIAVKDNEVIVKEVTVTVVVPSKLDAIIYPIIQTEYLKIESSSREQDAERLAKVFKDLALQLRSGDIKDIQELLDRTAIANRDTLGTQAAVWTPLLRALNTQLEALEEAGNLPDNDAVFDFWVSVHNGLIKMTQGFKDRGVNVTKQTRSLSSTSFDIISNRK